MVNELLIMDIFGISRTDVVDLKQKSTGGSNPQKVASTQSKSYQRPCYVIHVYNAFKAFIQG